MSSFTVHQQRAISARGNVLVQAGAGAGKTRTLVERGVSWLMENAENSLDQILMVTFTEAAAAEMRQRIRIQLTRALEDQPGHRHLTEQLALLETAHISTLHSFCFHIVRQHFYELELDPQLAVLAEEEAILLAHETLTAVLQRHYAGELPHSEAVLQLIQAHARGWEQPIRRLVLRLHEYTQTLPDPAPWFRSQLACLNESEPRQWANWLSEALRAWREAWLPELRAFADTPAVAKCIAVLEALPEQPNFSIAHAALASIEEADGTASLWPRGSKGRVRDAIENFFAETEFLQSLTGAAAGGSSSPSNASAESAGKIPVPLREDWAWSRGAMITLLQLAQDFGNAFAEEKRELGVVDFHDLEQFTLRLLLDQGTRQPTRLAEQWRAKLRLIFVDEYQDINAAQDTILQALAHDGAEANRFLVGDVKQSVYRFRLADPHIFQNYAEDWRNNPARGQVIPLSDNFRSHESILAFVNAFFDAVMRKEVGGVEFGPEAWLRFGHPEERPALSCVGEVASGAAVRPVPHVELHLRLTGANSLGNDEDESAESSQAESQVLAELSKTENEARMIGLRLRELVEAKSQIWDESSKQSRPVEWRDIVILLRSRQGKIESFAKEFERLGIPLLAPQGSFFESLEVMDLLNLLKLLDNPLQDIETIAALRSPLVGLTLDELATIRLAAKGGRFWTALQNFHRIQKSESRSQKSVVEDAQRLAEPRPRPSATDNKQWTTDNSPSSTLHKIDRFLKSFSRWRTLARQSSLSQCLEQILIDTHYSDWLLTQPRAPQRQANLAKLFAWARQFDQFHRQGLFRFLRFIEAQQDAEIDHEPAPPETGNAVRVMSIHQSKGLEFPVVVVADLGKSFNLSNLNDDIILDEKYGVCPQVTPPMTRQRYPSLPYWLAQRRQRTEALGEELRILYVAMTRACHSLILTGTASRKRSEERWPAASALTTPNVLQARSYLDWIGPWLPRITSNDNWATQPGGEVSLLRWTIYEDQDARLGAPPENAGVPVTDKIDEGDEPRRDMELHLNWRYPHAAATLEPAKASVSALRRRVVEERDAEAHALPFTRLFGTSPLRHGSPKLSAAEIGTAHHTFLQFVSLESVMGLAQLESEARRLVREGVLNEHERQTLDLPGIASFWQSEVGQRILAHRTALHRELPFTARLRLAELHELLPNRTEPAATSPELSAARTADEFVVIQGAVDLAVVLPEEIWLLDFKTDAVLPHEWSEKTKAYGSQLKLYALALDRIYRRPVACSWLHFLALRKTVACLR